MAGKALEPAHRTLFERRYGSPFDDVRLHADEFARSYTASLGARAATAGTDLFFADEKGTRDTRLLAHELAHVVQQRHGLGSGGITRGAHPLERAADHAARSALFGSAPVAVAGAAGGSVQLQDALALAYSSVDPDALSGTELEAAVNELRSWLLEHQETSADHTAVEQRLGPLEAALSRRQAVLVGTRGLVQHAAQVQREHPLLTQPVATGIAQEAFTTGFLAAAMLELRPAEFDVLATELREHEFRFKAYATAGVFVGAARGVWANIEGLWELVKILYWTSPVGVTHAALGEAVEFAQHPAQYIADAQANARRRRALLMALLDLAMAMANDPAFLTVHGAELGEIVGRNAAAWFNDDFMRRSVDDKGLLIGEIVGRVVIEIAMLFLGPEEWIARGVAAIGQGIRIGGELVRAIRVFMEGIPVLRELLALRRAAREAEAAQRALREAEELARVARELEEANRLRREAEAADRARRELEDADRARRELEEAERLRREADAAARAAQEQEAAVRRAQQAAQRPPQRGPVTASSEGVVEHARTPDPVVEHAPPGRRPPTTPPRGGGAPRRPIRPAPPERWQGRAGEMVEQDLDAAGQRVSPGDPSHVEEVKPDLSDAATPGGRAQPAAFTRGNFVHQYAEALIDEAHLPRGLEAEVEVVAGDGTQIFLDRMDREAGVFYEIRPDTPAQVADMTRQLPGRARILNEELPLGPGRTWRGVIVTYTQQQALDVLVADGYSRAEAVAILAEFGFRF